MSIAGKVARVAQLWRELPLKVALGEIAWEFAHKMLRPNAVVGYAQFGETHLAKGFLDINRPGFYVDVGCNHPRNNSNTFEFYLRGWRGLAIDANPECTAVYSRWRRRDTVVTAAIAADERSAVLTLERSTLMSSLSQEFVDQMIPADRISGSLKVTTRTLGAIMDEARVPASFELLSIDVEGVDDAVLGSFDIEKFRPKLIMIELHGIDLTKASTHPIVRYLSAADYHFISLCRFTGIFLDQRGQTDTVSQH